MGFTAFVATLLTVAVVYTITLFPRYRHAERIFLDALDGSRRSSGALPRRGEEWARRWALEPYYRLFAGAIDLGRHQVDPALEGLRQRARFLKSVWLWGLWPIAFGTASLATIVISSPQPTGLVVPIFIASVAATIAVAIKLRATRPREIARHLTEAGMVPRPLTSNERGLLQLALASISDDRCRALLLDQVEAARVVSEHSAVIDLDVASPIDPACPPDRNGPIEGAVRDAEGAVVGGILVLIRGGALRSLECYSLLDQDATELPDPSLVSIYPPRDFQRR